MPQLTSPKIPGRLLTASRAWPARPPFSTASLFGITARKYAVIVNEFGDIGIATTWIIVPNEEVFSKLQQRLHICAAPCGRSFSAAPIHGG